MNTTSNHLHHSAARALTVAAGLGLLAGSVAQAATFTWDTVPGTVGPGNSTITSAAGTWDTSTGNWTSDGGANNVAWNNANLDSAYFTYAASPYTVTLGANVTAGSILRSSSVSSQPITINPDAGGLYKITLDPPTKSGSYQITIGDAQTRPLIINAPIELAGWTHQFRGKVTVNGVISGSNKLRYYSSYSGDALTLSGNNTFTGGFEHDATNYGKLVVGHDNALGTGGFTWNNNLRLEATNGDRVIANSVPAVNWHIKRIVTGANDITFTGSYKVQAYQGADYASLDVQDPGCVVTFRNFHTEASGANTGAGFKKLGAGTMVLENSFTVDNGSPLPFTVEGGTLRVNTYLKAPTLQLANASAFVSLGGGTTQVSQASLGLSFTYGATLDFDGGGLALPLSANDGEAWDLASLTAIANSEFTAFGTENLGRLVFQPITLDAQDYTLIFAIPEPSTLFLIACGGWLLLRFGRRRGREDGMVNG